jgi:hypothetical protein
MNPSSETAYIAFAGDRCIAAGDHGAVAAAAKQVIDRDKAAQILVFDAGSSAPIEIDFRGSVADVLARLPDVAIAPTTTETTSQPPPRGPGRPKLGVVAREVTLLPRHWDWLARQPGGASVALRKLVEQARRASDDTDRIRGAQDAAYRFMSVMAGNRSHYEDAIRALFANDPAGFEKSTAGWPADVRGHAARLAERAFRREPAARAG